MHCIFVQFYHVFSRGVQIKQRTELQFVPFRALLFLFS